MRLTVPSKCEKSCDPHLNCSREITPKVATDDIFDSFFRDNFRPEVASDTISGVAVKNVILCQTILEIFKPLTVMANNDDDRCRSRHKTETPPCVLPNEKYAK